MEGLRIAAVQDIRLAAAVVADRIAAVVVVHHIAVDQVVGGILLAVGCTGHSPVAAGHSPGYILLVAGCTDPVEGRLHSDPYASSRPSCHSLGRLLPE